MFTFIVGKPKYALRVAIAESRVGERFSIVGRHHLNLFSVFIDGCYVILILCGVIRHEPFPYFSIEVLHPDCSQAVGHYLYDSLHFANLLSSRSSVEIDIVHLTRVKAVLYYQQ